MKSRFKDFMKKHIARVLAVVMAFSTFASSGLALNSVQAAPTVVYGDTLVDKLVEIAASGTPYVWGGQSRSGVDCSNYIVLAMKEIFGTNVFHLESNPSKTFELSWTGSYIPNFGNYVGQRIYIEGNGKRMYFTIDVAATQGELINQGYGIANIPSGDYLMSSYLSKEAKTPGTIICYNGHCVTGIGVFNSKEEVIAKYPSLNRQSAGTNGGPLVTFYSSYYVKGNSYSPTDEHYWFGKTCYIAAASPASGLKVCNASATGKTPGAPNSAAVCVLRPDTAPQTSQLKIIKVDAASGAKVPGAKYGIYKDQTCRQLVQEITTSSDYITVTIERGTYYVKETHAPNGYQLSTVVTKVDCTGESATITLKDDATKATLLVRKVDSHDPSILLSKTTIKLYEYNKSTATYSHELCTLSWSEAKQGYVINGAYTNNEGTQFKDNTLHATPTNQGYFKIEETEPQAGYLMLTDHSKTFNILTDNTVFTGNNALKNTAKVALMVKKVDNSGAALSGAKFKFVYDGHTYSGTTDSTGYVIWSGTSGNKLVMTEGATLQGVLTETEAPSGYVVSPQYASGKTIALSKASLSQGSYLTEIKVKNDTTPPPDPYNGKIKISKIDLTILGDLGVANAHYGVFTDEACTVPAKDIHNVSLADVVTDANGVWKSDELAPGVYYVKEISAPDGYGIQLKKFVINIPGDDPGAVYTPRGVGDKRQAVSLDIEKTNENGEPLAGAIFALYLDSDAVSLQFHKDINGGLVGYYRTDENGKISVDAFRATNVTSDDGVNFVCDCKTAADGTTLDGEGLPNGKYHFVEVAAPEGYVFDETEYALDASWRENKTAEEVVESDNDSIYTVGFGGNTLNVKVKNAVVNQRQSVSIKVQKIDFDLGTAQVFDLYGLTEQQYNVLAGTQVASLREAEYALVAMESLVINGIKVEAGTTVAVEKTNVKGELKFENYNSTGLTGPLQNGVYKIVEVTPSYGYALSEDGVVVDASWQNDAPVLRLSSTVKEKILKQAVEITKIDGDSAQPIADVTFEMYPVSTILANGGNVNTLTREAFQQMIDSGVAVAGRDLYGRSSWKTGDDGKATTGLFVFDTYVLWEKSAPAYYSDHLADPIIVSIPSVLTEGSDSSGSGDAEVNYAHVVTEQPAAPFEVEIINFSGKAFVKIIKVDSETGETIDFGEFKIYDNAGSLITQGTKGNPWRTSGGSFTTVDPLELGNYIIEETKAPNGYVGLASDINLDMSQGSATATVNGMTLEVTRTLNSDNKVLVTIKVPNVKTTAAFAKYEIVNGEKVHVDGVTLKLLDANNGVVDRWNTINDNATFNGIKVHEIRGLVVGETYTLVEESVPGGYAQAAPVSVTINNTTDVQYFEMENKPTQIRILKVDNESNEALPGAELQILYADSENLVTTVKGETLKWVTDGNAKIFKYIKPGEYILRETHTPDGYQHADDIRFSVVNTTSEVQVVPTMSDPRTYGMIEINKRDSVTDEPLKDVKFEIRSKNNVTDSNGNVIFAADELIETITTNSAGYARMTSIVPIATYDNNGLKDYIEYYIVETEAPKGQYAIATISGTITFRYLNDSTPIITKTLDITNDKPVVEVTKTGVPTTFVGKYEDKDRITVLKDGDEITYTISVTNTGMASAYNITVKDALPEHTTFVSATNLSTNETYELKNNVLYATIAQVEAGSTVQIEMKVKVDSPSANEIVNIAYYTMPDTIDNGYVFDENEEHDWTATDCVVHQVVEFHKTSEILGGSVADDATAVTYGDTIKYTLTFINKDVVKDVTVTDIVPEGLTYVTNSATIDGVIAQDVTYNPSTRVVNFGTSDMADGTHKFAFDVTVDYVAANTRKDFDNVASVTFTNSEYDNTTDTIESEHMTHYAEAKFEVVKHGTPTTYEGPKDGAHDLTVLQKGEDIEYTITVTNTGASKLKNIVIADAVPTGTVYVDGSATSDYSFSEIDGKFVWIITELDVAASVDLKFTVSVEKQEAAIIDNVALYAIVPEIDVDNPVIPPDMSETNHVIHQVVEFHKTSEIPGGDSADSAAVVATDDTIVYTLVYTSKAPTSGVVVGDQVPDGLTLVPGSIQYKLPDSEEWVLVSDEEGVVEQDGKLWVIFPAISPSDGTTYFRFSTTVNRIPLAVAKATYVNKAAVAYDRETNNQDSEKDNLISDEIFHMTEVSLTGVKTSDTPTFVGTYENRENVTVVSVGDPIVYTITVTNTGVSDLHNIVIRDTVPANTTLSEEENPAYRYDEETNTLYWTIDEIVAGESASVSFTVKCTAPVNTAAEIVNIAEYAVPVDPEHIDDDEWIETDAIVYQLVEFHKDCSIDHGIDESDALFVEIGSKFSYILTFTCVDDVYGLIVSDEIPVGLKFVEGSAKKTIGDVTENITATVDPENNLLVFEKLEEVKTGKVTFTFDVEVLDVEEYDKDYFFVNQATAITQIRKDDEKVVELISETISHKTNKTNTTDIPVLGLEGMNAATGWSVIAVLSFVAMVVFGYFGFVDKKKKKY